MTEEQERIREKICSVLRGMEREIRYSHIDGVEEFADDIIALEGMEIRADDQTAGPLENWVKVVVVVKEI